MEMHRFCNTGFNVDNLVWFIIAQSETRVGLVVGQETETITFRGEDKIELDEWLRNKLCPEE